jgi:hypothetical protein
MSSKTLTLIKEVAVEQNFGLTTLHEARIKRKHIEVGTGSGGDAAGKAFEVHVAKHVGHILRGGTSAEEHYPEHFSDESGDTPQQSVKKQKTRLGKTLHNQVERHARRMAYHIVNHMKKQGVQLDNTSKIHWTSKPKDLERLTNKKGIKGTADITITHAGKHHGFSLKYSTSQTKPSLRSPGINDLNTMLKADHEHVHNLIKDSGEKIKKTVGNYVGTGNNDTKHEAFKNLLTRPSSSHEHKAARAALDHSKSLHHQLASHYSDSFNKLNHEEKKSFIRKMIDAEKQPTIKPYRASYNGAKNTSYITNPTKDFDETDLHTHSYSSESSGASVNIYAHHHDGSKTKVSSLGIKNKFSSPFKGIGGRVSDVSKTTTRMRLRIRKKVNNG